MNIYDYLVKNSEDFLKSFPIEDKNYENAFYRIKNLVKFANLEENAFLCGGFIRNIINKSFLQTTDIDIFSNIEDILIHGKEKDLVNFILFLFFMDKEIVKSIFVDLKENPEIKKEKYVPSTFLVEKKISEKFFSDKKEICDFLEKGNLEEIFLDNSEVFNLAIVDLAIEIFDFKNSKMFEILENSGVSLENLGFTFCKTRSRNFSNKFKENIKSILKVLKFFLLIEKNEEICNIEFFNFLKKVPYVRDLSEKKLKNLTFYNTYFGYISENYNNIKKVLQFDVKLPKSFMNSTTSFDLNICLKNFSYISYYYSKFYRNKMFEPFYFSKHDKIEDYFTRKENKIISIIDFFDDASSSCATDWKNFYIHVNAIESIKNNKILLKENLTKFRKYYGLRILETENKRNYFDVMRLTKLYLENFDIDVENIMDIYKKLIPLQNKSGSYLMEMVLDDMFYQEKISSYARNSDQIKDVGDFINIISYLERCRNTGKLPFLECDNNENYLRNLIKKYVDYSPSKERMMKNLIWNIISSFNSNIKNLSAFVKDKHFACYPYVVSLLAKYYEKNISDVKSLVQKHKKLYDYYNNIQKEIQEYRTLMSFDVSIKDEFKIITVSKDKRRIFVDKHFSIDSKLALLLLVLELSLRIKIIKEPETKIFFKTFASFLEKTIVAIHALNPNKGNVFKIINAILSKLSFELNDEKFQYVTFDKDTFLEKTKNTFSLKARFDEDENITNKDIKNKIKKIITKKLVKESPYLLDNIYEDKVICIINPHKEGYFPERSYYIDKTAIKKLSHLIIIGETLDYE